MNAKEAHKLSSLNEERIRSNLVKDQIKFLKTKIFIAINHGDYEFTIQVNEMLDKVKIYFQNLGYVVTRSGNFYQISWR